MILCQEVLIHALFHSDITYAVGQMFETIYPLIYPMRLARCLKRFICRFIHTLFLVLLQCREDESTPLRVVQTCRLGVQLEN